MLTGLSIEEFSQDGCVTKDFPGTFRLRVENPQWIVDKAPLAVFIKISLITGQVLHQAVGIVSSRRRITQRIQFQPHLVRYSEATPEPRTKQQQLRIDIRTGHAKAFNADLLELAIPAFLGTLVSEHGTGVPETLHLIEEQSVFFS